jgi:anti-anti-sigma factor
MTFDIPGHDGCSRISLTGRFDFSKHRNFRDASEKALATGQSVHVDLREVTYIDSSALGMLLLLREKAHAIGKKVTIATKPGVVNDILGVAKFDGLFAITPH